MCHSVGAIPDNDGNAVLGPPFLFQVQGFGLLSQRLALGRLERSVAKGFSKKNVFKTVCPGMRLLRKSKL